MRLRRETGDFNLVFDWTKEQYECRIRKGLNPEDLVGTVIATINAALVGGGTVTQIATVGVVTKNSNESVITLFAKIQDSELVAAYDQGTGIVECRPADSAPIHE